MKHLKTSLALFAFFLLIGLSSCQKGNIDTPIEPSIGDNELTTMTVYQPDLTIPENLDEMPTAVEPPNTGDRNPNDKRNLDNTQDRLNPFARIFRSLNLTERQIAQIKILMKERDDCIRRLMIMLRESEKAILDRANLEKREVMNALKNGRITREEAKRKHAAIDKLTREALKNNPVRVRVMEAIKKCEDEFFRKVGSHLDEVQLPKWQEFVKKYVEMRDKKRMATDDSGDNELTLMSVYQPDFSVPENLDEMPTGVEPPTGGNSKPSLGNSQDMLNPFAKIFRDLKLTPEQMAKIKILMKERDDCIRKLMLLLRESEKAILDKANQEKRKVMAALKEGTITREEAKKKIMEIDKLTRQALLNNPARLKVMEATKKCEDEFFRKVGTTLDKAQLAKWEAFVKKYVEMRDKKRPTTGSTKG